MIKTRTTLDLSKNTYSYNDARSLYFSNIYALCRKGQQYIYINDIYSDMQKNEVNKLLAWLQLSNYTTVLQTGLIRNCIKIVERLIKTEKAYVEDSVVKLDIDMNLVGKTWKDFINDTKYTLSTKDINKAGNIILVNREGVPTKHLMNVVHDYFYKITNIFSDTYHLSNSIKEMILRCVLGYPIVEYGHFGCFTHKNEVLQLGDKSLNILHAMRTCPYDNEAYCQFLLLSGWKPRIYNSDMLYSKLYINNHLLSNGKLCFKNTELNYNRLNDIKYLYDREIAIIP